MLLTNTKITSKAYFHKRMGYNVVFNMASTTATGGTQGGVGLVVRDRLQGWSV